MTPEKIEIVAKAIKDVLWENAQTSHPGKDPEDALFPRGQVEDHSVGLDDGNDDKVAKLAAEAAIKALRTLKPSP
jgi:hypothetical protein